MQDGADRDAVIARAASDSRGAHHILRVFSRPGVDWVGDEALWVAIMLAGHGEVSSGEETLDTISAVHRALQSVGDQRLPLVEFTHEHDLASDADPESDPPS